MKNIEWIVPIVVFAVYVLSAIFKAKEQANQQAQQPLRRNPGQELDRFLQEIERLRRQQESRSPATQNSSTDVDEDEMPTEERPVVIVREVRSSPLLPRQVILQVQPSPQTQSRDPEPAERTPQVVLASKAPTVSYERRSSVNPAVNVIQLLRNPKNIATAIVLHEVLGPPKCKR